MGQIDLDGSNSTVKADIIRGQSGTTVKLGGLLDTDGNYIQTEKGGDIASASPLIIDTDGSYFDVTGTTGFSAMTVAADRQFTLQFDGVLGMTHHATNLDLPGEANITTAAGDVAIFQSTGSNTVQCISYTKADGSSVVGGGAPEGTAILSTGEAGGSKFLREDGDGTSSWQTPSAHTPEGTAVLSTGEAGGSKFLREDGDNSCSWQAAPVTSVSGSTGVVADGDIDHDSLANFASNEHFTQANITATGTVASGTWSSTISSATLGATLSCADVTIERPEFKDYGETLTTANTSTTYTIDLTNGNVFELTLTGNCTYTFSNPPGSGIGGSFTLIQKQDGSGSRTVSWPASVDWAGGEGPTISSGANDVDVFTFVTTDAGTTWYGFTAGQDFS
jgi:hypothetical protein